MADSKRETMTPRQRVLCALNHQTPDRVPIDLGGFQTGIHRLAYQELIDYLGLDESVNILDPVQQLAKPSEDVLRRFHADFRYICAQAPADFKGGIVSNIRNARQWLDLKDEFGVVWSTPADQKVYMDISCHPLADADIKHLDEYPWPNGKDESRFAGTRQKVLELRRHTPYAVATGIGGVIYEYGWYLRGLERWLMDTIENQDFCAAVLDKMLTFWMNYYTGFMREIGDLVDVIMIGDDIAGQYGPLFSPVFYRQIVKPRHKRLVSHIKSLTSAKIWYHTCGACSCYIDDLSDNGVDILNPVQIQAANMEPAYLKENFGDKIVFWGGAIDSQHVLPFASPAQVREAVKQNLQIFKPRGGYVFNNVHNIQAGVPAENIVAMYDAAYEFGFY